MTIGGIISPYLDGTGSLDTNNKWQLASATNPIPVYFTEPVTPAAWVKGQVVIAVTGTAVALSATSQVLQNGVIVTAATGNNSSGGTIGTSTVTNTVNGTGNGDIIYAGGSKPVVSGVNLNTIYVNGTAGDIFSYSGS